MQVVDRNAAGLLGLCPARREAPTLCTADRVVRGIRLNYAKGAHKPDGTCARDASHICDPAKDGFEVVGRVIFDCTDFDSAVKLDNETEEPGAVSTPAASSQFWGPLRGLFTFSVKPTVDLPSGTPCIHALDRIDLDWEIKSTVFASKEGNLGGQKRFILTGKELVHVSLRWRCGSASLEDGLLSR
ncbi:hypothetical protein C8A03DRAFT_34872 [Achaetomium macrosporum]|uniref:Uncharacterized protein n=1 Tax=Achaetomium macrosporum TaxID=79813 RepID=A0AAN7H6D6_9PEZI|nr:hypothetical protein C8A03DRAFT_34872 [Achaetomium macrosporum]